ncbi:hypothetical protein EJD97_001819 [Solanum chilense]|uniref:Uncharacterized protein n=1 Tax=Solanum chilense TaxID=4083 RepID=A0A6N2BXB7_SOLCI|nr:hypothetical protein EJD97_001819 [Solanum chilense]
MKTPINCGKIAEVMTYGAIDGPLTPRLSVGGTRHLKRMLLKEDQGILTKCESTEAINLLLSPRRIVLHIRNY